MSRVEDDHAWARRVRRRAFLTGLIVAIAAAVVVGILAALPDGIRALRLLPFALTAGCFVASLMLLVASWTFRPVLLAVVPEEPTRRTTITRAIRRGDVGGLGQDDRVAAIRWARESSVFLSVQLPSSLLIAFGSLALVSSIAATSSGLELLYAIVIPLMFAGIVVPFVFVMIRMRRLHRVARLDPDQMDVVRSPR